MIYTAGIFLFRDFEKEFLIVHPTHAPMDEWSIPKGECSEHFRDNAIRELLEETNIPLMQHGHLNDISYVGVYPYKNFKKCLVAFSTHVSPYELENCKLKCSSMVTTSEFCDPFPEVDNFMWVGITEGLSLIHPAQQLALIDIKKGNI